LVACSSTTPDAAIQSPDAGRFLAAPFIAWVLCAPQYLTGTMSLGEVAQAAAGFVMMQTALDEMNPDGDSHPQD
jgi:ABC-type uncharacterized transport system fused permease/ATPase subunit